MIAALYVEKDGCYFGIDGVDTWDEERDARMYPGPHPIIAHPPPPHPDFPPQRNAWFVWDRDWRGAEPAFRLMDRVDWRQEAML